jgi:DNA-binding protein HU-beta
MTKSELITAIAGAIHLKKTEVAEVLEQLEHEAMGALYRGEDAVLPGLGKLELTDRAARNGRNPATGEAMEIPAKKVVRFKPSQELRAFAARV